MMTDAPDLLRGPVNETHIGGKQRRSNRSRPPAPIQQSKPPKPKTKAERRRGRGGG